MKLKKLKQVETIKKWNLKTDEGYLFTVVEYDNGRRIKTEIFSEKGEKVNDKLYKQIYKIFHNHLYGIILKIK